MGKISLFSVGFHRAAREELPKPKPTRGGMVIQIPMTSRNASFFSQPNKESPKSNSPTSVASASISIAFRSSPSHISANRLSPSEGREREVRDVQLQGPTLAVRFEEEADRRKIEDVEGDEKIMLMVYDEVSLDDIVVRGHIKDEQRRALARLLCVVSEERTRLAIFFHYRNSNQRLHIEALDGHFRLALKDQWNLVRKALYCEYREATTRLEIVNAERKDQHYLRAYNVQETLMRNVIEEAALWEIDSLKTDSDAALGLLSRKVQQEDEARQVQQPEETPAKGPSKSSSKRQATGSKPAGRSTLRPQHSDATLRPQHSDARSRSSSTIRSASQSARPSVLVPSSSDDAMLTPHASLSFSPMRPSQKVRREVSDLSRQEGIDTAFIAPTTDASVQTEGQIVEYPEERLSAIPAFRSIHGPRISVSSSTYEHEQHTNYPEEEDAFSPSATPPNQRASVNSLSPASFARPSSKFNHAEPHMATSRQLGQDASTREPLTASSSVRNDNRKSVDIFPEAQSSFAHRDGPPTRRSDEAIKPPSRLASSRGVQDDIPSVKKQSMPPASRRQYVSPEPTKDDVQEMDIYDLYIEVLHRLANRPAAHDLPRVLSALRSPQLPLQTPRPPSRSPTRQYSPLRESSPTPKSRPTSAKTRRPQSARSSTKRPTSRSAVPAQPTPPSTARTQYRRSEPRALFDMPNLVFEV